MRFIESSLYLQIAQADKVYTELPFVVNQAMVDQLPEDNQDVSIIQGMIDLIFKRMENTISLIIKQMHLIDEKG